MAILAGWAFTVIAQDTSQDWGEPVNSLWLVVASVCIYLIGYPFYACFLAGEAPALEDRMRVLYTSNCGGAQLQATA